jgi:hypothetical protein
MKRFTAQAPLHGDAAVGAALERYKVQLFRTNKPTFRIFVINSFTALTNRENYLIASTNLEQKICTDHLLLIFPLSPSR